MTDQQSLPTPYGPYKEGERPPEPEKIRVSFGYETPPNTKIYSDDQVNAGLPDQEGYRILDFDYGLALVKQFNFPNQSYFAEDPKRLVKYYEFLQSADPEWEPPSWMNIDRIVAGYNYMVEQYGSDWENWEQLDPDDPGAIFLTTIMNPPKEYQLDGETSEYQQLMDALNGDQETSPFMDTEGGWEDLEPWQQLMMTVFNPQPMSGRSDTNIKISSGFQGAQAALGGFGLGIGASALIGAVTGTSLGPVGTILGLVLGGAAGYAAYRQSYTGEEVPVLNDILAISNWPTEKLEQLIGLGFQLAESDTKEVLENIPEALKAGKLQYETHQRIGTWLTNAVSAAAVGAEVFVNWFKPEGEKVNLSSGQQADYDAGEVWYLEKAIAEPMLVEGGVLAGSALDEVRARIIASDAAGAEGESWESIYADFVDRMGYSGTLTDFIAQTILDPLNFAPMVSNLLGEGIGKITGNDALVAAVKSTRGNIVTDMMPMGVQQAFEAITGLKGTQGLLMSLDTYSSYIRGGYVPNGGTSINAADLTPAQKWFGRLTDEGEFMELQPTVTTADTPKYKKWMTYLTELTPEAKAATFIDLAHTNMSAILSMAEGDPAGMVKLMRQVAQVDPVAVGQIGEALINSPASATVSTAMKDFINNGLPDQMLSVWEATTNPRTQLNNMADVLGENPGRLLELIDSEPDAVLQRILNAAEGKSDPISASIAEAIKAKALTADNLKKMMAPFLGDNPVAWHPDEFQAQLVVKMADHLDNFLVKRYNIQPESWVFRMSNAMKSFQSLAVLGFNPLYAVNNWVNNVATRAAQGVFGFMTTKQIDGFWDRMGIKPANLDAGIGMAGDAAGGVGQMTRSAISAAADPGDWISKVQQVGKKVSKLGIFSQIASKIEVAESRQATTIGAMQMWSKLWREGSGFSKLPAGVEARLRTISPQLPDMLYSLVRSGMNMDEITTKLYGDSTFRGIEGVVDEASRRVFPNAPEVARQLLDSTGVKQELDSLLSKAKTTQDVDRAYDYINTKINDIVDQATANDLIARAEDVANRIETEGWAATMPLWGEQWDAFSQRQLDDLIENGIAAQTADNLRAMGEWDQANNVWASRMAQSDQDWSRTNATMLQTAKGIIDALDATSPAGQKYINLMSQWMDDWNEFFVAKKNAIQRYKNGDFAVSGKRGTGWDTVQKLISDLYTEHVKKERLTFEQMFETLGEVYEQTSKYPAQDVIDWGNKVMEVRDRTTAEITKFRAELNKANYTADERAAAWTTFNNEILRPLITERRDVTVKGAYDLAAGRATPDLTSIENPADIVAADMNAKRIRSQADQALIDQILKADMVMNRTTFEGQVRSAFDLGDEQLAGVMALVDAHARVWADANNSSPNKWYAEHLAAVVKSGDPSGLNALLQSGARGNVDFLADGRAVIKAFEAGDVSTVVHELGHIFRRDLDGTDLDAVAKWGELADGAELTKLQQAFQDGTISKADRARYVAAEEKFANGWERYLADGKAPTPKLVAVFKKFTSWLVEIYRSLTGRGAKGTIGSELADTPLNVNLADEVQVGNKYIKMRDVFDRMLASEGDIVRYKWEQGETQPQWLIDKYLGPEQMVQQAEEISTGWRESVMDEVAKPSGEVQPTDPLPNLEIAGADPAFTYADLDKPISEWPEWSRPAAERALYDMIAEMDEGHPGKRVLIRSKDPVTGRGQVTGVMRDPSTYPDWYARNNLSGRQYKGQNSGPMGVNAVLDDLRNGVTDGNNKPLYKDVVDILLRRMLDTDELGNSLGYNTFDERYGQLMEKAEMWLASDKAPYDLQRIQSELETAAYNAQFRSDFVGVDDFIKQTNDMITRIDDRLKGRIYENVIKSGRQNSLGERIAFDVYQNGHKIAEVPAHFEQLQTVTVNNQTARILGLDPEQPRVIVYEVGDQIKYADRGNQNVLYQPAVGETPIGGTPTPQYEGSMLDEVNSGSLRKLLDQMREITTDDFQNSRSFKMADLPDDLVVEVSKWADQLPEQMAGTKLAATRYGEMQRNAALLDYKKRYGIDNVMQTIFPYEFWLTRSMGEWAKRAIDKPAWLAMYSRYRQLQEKMEQYGIPSRLKDKMRIPAAYLPDWMGNGLYIDPMKALFPFAQFGTALDLLSQKSDNVYDTAVRNVQAMVQEGMITAAQAEQVISSREGAIWEQALAEAQASLSDEIGDPMTMARLMMTPAMWWTYPYMIATGQKDKLNPLPLTRTGQAIRGLSDNSGIGGFIGNIMALPEETIRRKFNMNIYGEWGDYYLDRMLSNMAGDGTITADEAMTAMIERTGPIFDEATRRVEEELALKMPGSQTALAIKEGRLGAIPMTLLTTLFPAGILPQGELELRGLKEEYNQAWDAYNGGDLNAVNNFYEEHPEYQTRLALWDEPEERLRQNLVSQIWDKYTALDNMNKSLVADQLGEAFQQVFLNKDTRDYTAVDVETLAYWAQALGGDVPSTAETADIADLPLYQQPSLDIYSQEVVDAVNQFHQKRSELFPNYEYLQSLYYALPEDQRRAFLAENPELKKYWDWKSNYYEAVPIVEQWANEQQSRYENGDSLYTTTTANPYTESVQAYTSSMSPALRSQMLLTWYLGKDVSGGARLLLMQDWEALGQPGVSFEDWVNDIMRNGMGLGE